MARLKRLATSYLVATHPEQIAAVKAAFTGIVPETQLDARAKVDIFHYVSAQLYDTAGRSKNLRGEQATRAVDSVLALLATLSAESTQFEAYVLSQGVTKSNVPAPKSSGF
jgi:hypothetical protein